MSVECILDADILAHAALRHDDAAGERKRRLALDLIETADFGVSGQILQEFAAILLTKARPSMPAPLVHDWVERLSLRPVAPLDADLVLQALLAGERHKLSPYRAGIVAAAGALGASVIYSEEMEHGARYGAVRIVNPFAADGSLAG